jgi:uncharacterized protein (DUF2147 family)
MVRLTSRLFAGAMTILVSTMPQVMAQSGGQATVDGLWQHKNSDGKPEAWFRIQQRNGVYEGQIVRMFPKAGEDVTKLRCTGCEGEQKNAPVLGITFIKGMKRDGLRYEEGSILDPRDGSVYSAEMEVSRDGQRLTVRGYVGISLFGKSQVWDRLPDTAMDTISPPAGNTGAAAKRLPPKTKQQP